MVSGSLAVLEHAAQSQHHTDAEDQRSDFFHFLFPFSYSFNFSLLAPGTFARIYHFDSLFVFTSISTAATIITP